MTASALAPLLLRLGLLLALVLGAIWVVDLIKEALDLTIMPHNEALIYRTVLGAVLVYMVLMATPFLPGAEIGLLLLTAFGATVAPLVYAATIVALMVTFLVGHLVPGEVTARALETLRLHKAAALLRQVCAEPREVRLDVLMRGVESPWLRGMTRYRYVALAILLNIPGNVVIGGGGGLALVAGLSRVFHPALYLVTVALAVLPVPLAVMVAGS